MRKTDIYTANQATTCHFDMVAVDSKALTENYCHSDRPKRHNSLFFGRHASCVISEAAGLCRDSAAGDPRIAGGCRDAPHGMFFHNSYRLAQRTGQILLIFLLVVVQ